MTTGAFEVRIAEHGDRGAVARIQAASGRRVEIADTLGTAIADERRLVVVAVDDADIVIGWAMTAWFPMPSGAAPAGHYLTGVTVDPARRGVGVGAALTAARLAWLGPHAAEVWCAIAAENRASLALHRRAGFVEVGRARRIQTMTFAHDTGILLRARPVVPRAL